MSRRSRVLALWLSVAVIALTAAACTDTRRDTGTALRPNVDVPAVTNVAEHIDVRKALIAELQR